MDFEKELRVLSDEPTEYEVVRLMLSTGSGKTLSTLAMWEYLMADDDPTAYADTVEVTDEQLEGGLAAIKSREPAALPPDIEALGQEDRSDKPKKPSSSIACPWRVVPTSEDTHERPSRVRKLPAWPRDSVKSSHDTTWREQIRAAFPGSHSLPYERFYWRTEQKRRRDVDPLYAINLRKILDDLWREWTPLPREMSDRSLNPRYRKHFRSLLDIPMCDCRERPPGLSPWSKRRTKGSQEYLLALLVLPGNTHCEPRAPAWFTCEESAVRQVPAFTVPHDRWSVVVNVDADVAAAQALTVQAVAMELPATLHTDGTARQEDIRRLWETYWRDGVLQHLGND